MYGCMYGPSSCAVWSYVSSSGHLLFFVAHSQPSGRHGGGVRHGDDGGRGGGVRHGHVELP